jgi:hypothetical protein
MGYRDLSSEGEEPSNGDASSASSHHTKLWRKIYDSWVRPIPDTSLLVLREFTSSSFISTEFLILSFLLFPSFLWIL